MATLINKADLGRISAAIQRAEAATAGEIYVVVSGTSDDFRLVPVLWAAITAMLLPWPLLVLTDLSIGAILTAQVVLFVSLAIALSHNRIRPRLVPSGLIADASRQRAQALFMAHGVHLTENRTGILIYVAVIDRRVEILADATIHEKVGQAFWEELAQEVVTAGRHERWAEGVITAVHRAGSALALHFPRGSQDRNELSDRVVEV
jgi:putative membrane protein